MFSTLNLSQNSLVVAISIALNDFSRYYARILG
jgi:hypothetical protein